MSVNVDYTKRIGHFTLMYKDDEGKPLRYRIDMCYANCLCAMMYFYDKEDVDGKKTPMAMLWMFFNDLAHMKRCLKDDVLKNCCGFHFYTKEMSAEHWKMVKMLTSHGFDVKLKGNR